MQSTQMWRYLKKVNILLFENPLLVYLQSGFYKMFDKYILDIKIYAGGFGMYKIGICSDKKKTCANIEEYILQYCKKTGRAVETFVWYNGESFCKDINKIACIDLIFLDIELTDINGIEIGNYIREVQKDTKISIIFISFQTDYAMKLFRIHPFDFLIKPINYEKISIVLRDFFKISDSESLFFEYKLKSNIIKTPYNDILYFSSRDKQIEITLSNGEKKIFYGRLKEIEKKLPDDFICIHQSFIINQRFLKKYAYNNVIMTDENQFNISKRYRKIVHESIMNKKF